MNAVVIVDKHNNKYTDQQKSPPEAAVGDQSYQGARFG